ncbi:carboxymuconolactone decarboxylase family protein (plasmid) [Streptomyces sp. GDS52]|uniref:carboxymuconolactone decarboxylase family protein n=1 Tax=Streptomyces sp. GDS52 TaxID=3406419 RepID=UPI003FD612F4
MTSREHPAPMPSGPRERAPVRVPDALTPLFAHHPEALPLLRQARVGLQTLSGLPDTQVEMVTLAALLALGAPAEAFHAHTVRARRLGLSEGEIWGVFEALAVIVGIPRLVAAVPTVAAALEAVRSEGASDD